MVGCVCRSGLSGSQATWWRLRSETYRRPSSLSSHHTGKRKRYRYLIQFSSFFLESQRFSGCNIRLEKSVIFCKFYCNCEKVLVKCLFFLYLIMYLASIGLYFPANFETNTGTLLDPALDMKEALINFATLPRPPALFTFLGIYLSETYLCAVPVPVSTVDWYVGQYFLITLQYLSFSACFKAISTLPSIIASPVFRIHDILALIRICGSMPLTNRSGSGYFRHWPSRRQQKTNLKKKFFCLLLFEGIFTSFLKDKKFKRSHKAVGIKVFLTIFAWW